LLVSTDTPADVKIHIGPALTEIKDQHVVSSTGYNGQAPGPVIRLKEGKQVTVALINDTDVPEFAHRHGQMIPSLADGAPEEKGYVVPPHGQLHYRFTPGPSGSRWLHSHVVAGSNLHLGTYTGQFAFVYIEPVHEPNKYDAEFFLTTHGWEPYFN
jgi:FtsP/CotA-like multicopper oxidase with cupredoxin domain